MKKRQEIYDLYWYFANERQNIFIKKLQRLMKKIEMQQVMI